MPDPRSSDVFRGGHSIFASVLAMLVIGLAGPVRAQDLVIDPEATVLSPLRGPADVSVGPNGRIYVAEEWGHRVSVFERDGTLVRTFGEFGHADGQLNGPRGVAVGPDGRVYVADTGNDRICVFTTDGTFMESWGTRGLNPPGLAGPAGMTIRDDMLYIADSGNAQVQVYNLDGVFQSRRVGGLQHNDALSNPTDVGVQEDGTVFVADAERDALLRLDNNGRSRLLGQWGTYPGLLASPGGIDVFAETVFVADTRNDRLQTLAFDGTPHLQFNATEAGGEALVRPTGVSVDPQGRFVVVSEPLADRCRVFKLRAPRPDDRTAWTPAGPHVGDLMGAGNGLVVFHDDGLETVAILDARSGRLVRLTDLGTRGQPIGRFVEPREAVVDEKGLIHIVDTGNGRIQVFKLAPGLDSDYNPVGSSLVRAIILQASLPQELLNGLEWLARPDDLVQDDQGRWIVLDARNVCLLVFDAEFKAIDAWRPHLADAEGLKLPVEMAFDAANQRLLVLDCGRREVVSIGMHGHLLESWILPGADELSAPTSLAIAGDTVLVTDAASGVIARYGLDGHRLDSWVLAPVTPGGSVHLGEIECDESGRIFVADRGASRIREIDADGRDVANVASERPGATGTQPLFPPTADSGADGWHEMTSAEGNFVVRWRTTPEEIPLNDVFSIEVHALDAKTRQEPADSIRIGLDATMPHHKHGMIEAARLRRRGPATFTSDNMKLHMAGQWVLTVDVISGGLIERAECTVEPR
jgi:DNA-binding beta-propeller fold protein YncE